jgi:hypothetical protein
MVMASLIATSISLISCFGAITVLVAVYQIYFIDIEGAGE